MHTFSRTLGGRDAARLLRVGPMALGVVLLTGACAPRGTVGEGPRVAAPVAAPADGLDPDLTLIDLATSDEGGWPRYRIPALTTALNGDLLAFYDGRPTMNDLPSHIAVLMRRSTDGGRTWLPQEVVRSGPAPIGFGDPSVIVDRVTGDVFVFYASSVNVGFGNSSTGTDANDPDVQHADYSVSRDNGVSWTHHRITPDLKRGRTDWAGMFAASGEGIQLRRGRYRGRLLQQYALRIGGENFAVSAWSDDHGRTWRTGTPVGPGADENKTVELADGRLMLNSRATPYRKVAYSVDGGATWSPLVADSALPDQGNNGSIIRAFPDAPPDDPRAAMLLFSNTPNQHVRRNLTVRLSCDNGITWPVHRVVQTGASAYSTLTPLRGRNGALGGRYGLLYEREGYRHISYTSFALDWLATHCATPTPAPAPPPRTSDAALLLRPVLDAIHPGGPDGPLGDRIQPWVEVINTGSEPISEIEITATQAVGNCRITSLAPGATAVCRNNAPNRVIGADDLAAGTWSPVFRATGSAGGATVEASAALYPVSLRRKGRAVGAATVFVPGGDFATSSLVRVPRTGEVGAPLAAGATLDLQVPRNSRLSAQLAISAPAGLRALRAVVGPIVAAGDGRSAAPTIEVSTPEYIIDVERGGVVADPLPFPVPVELAPGDNQPIWFTVRVPPGSVPGAYLTQVAVVSAGDTIGEYLLRLTVPDVTLRDVAERPFRLDLWAHPDAVADFLGVEPWSEEHFRALEPYWRDLAAAGQRVINLAVSDDPWLVEHQGTIRPQTASRFRSTVEWRWDGARFAFDFTVFDRLVRDALAAGIGPDIHAFGLLQFQGRDRLSYTDTRNGTQVIEEVGTDSPRYREAWVAFLVAFERHLRVRSWLEHTRLAFDEQPLARMQSAFALLRAADTAWLGRIALAANTLAESDLAEAISFNYAFLEQVPAALIARRRSAAQPTLFYTWAEPVVPNTIVATPPYNVRTLPWVAVGHGLGGYLRWAYNSWPARVREQPSFRYAQGDEYLVYPGDSGPVSSIRWELFQDGLEDAELLDLALRRGGRSADAARAALAAIDPAGASTPALRRLLGSERSRVIAALAGR